MSDSARSVHERHAANERSLQIKLSSCQHQVGQLLAQLRGEQRKRAELESLSASQCSLRKEAEDSREELAREKVRLTETSQLLEKRLMAIQRELTAVPARFLRPPAQNSPRWYWAIVWSCFSLFFSLCSAVALGVVNFWRRLVGDTLLGLLLKLLYSLATILDSVLTAVLFIPLYVSYNSVRMVWYLCSSLVVVMLRITSLWKRIQTWTRRPWVSVRGGWG